MDASLWAQLVFLVWGDGAESEASLRWHNHKFELAPIVMGGPLPFPGLIQHCGGPCGVLAPVQGHLLSRLLAQLPTETKLTLQSLTQMHSKWQPALTESLAEILWRCGGNRRCCVLSCRPAETPVTPTTMHTIVEVKWCTSLAEVQQATKDPSVVESNYAVVLLLYSALLSRGIDQCQLDREDTSMPLINHFGHAGQEICNLMLAGKATPNVFDHSKDLGGGLILHGIDSRSDVGFLTLLEAMRYCEVGRNYKRPIRPVWIVGSESHYTVIFCLDPQVDAESERLGRLEEYRAVFNRFDTQGNGFIATEQLGPLLEGLGIASTEQQVSAHASALDEAGCGIIVWDDFCVRCLPNATVPDRTESTDQQFEVFHFNGLAQNEAAVKSLTPKVAKMTIVSAEALVGGQGGNSGFDDPLTSVLRTKWPTAKVEYDAGAPSLT